jgi:hypothetical protein
MEKKELSPAQLEALRKFAKVNGRTWKANLNHAWMTGRYAEYGAADFSGWLQTVRNEFGPSWLVKFKFPEAA